MFRNTLAQSLFYFLSTILSVVLAPIMLAQLGLTIYGVWTVIGAVVMYAALLDAGIARSLARFVALYDARGEPETIKRCIGLGLIGVTVVGILLVPIGWIAGPILESALGVLTVEEMRLVMYASSAIFVAHGYAAVLAALPMGLRQMMPPNVALMIGGVVNFTVSVVVLLTSDSLVVYAWANAAAETATIGMMLIAVRRVWRAGIVAMPTWGLAKDVLGFSARAQAGWIADIVSMTSDRIVLGVIVDARAAGAYALASSVAMAIRSVGVLTVSAMIPTATADLVHGARDALRRMFRHYGPLSMGIAMPVFTLGGLAAPFLMIAWLGERTPDSVAILIVLCVAYAANVATGVATTLLTADGRPGFVSAFAACAAALNLVLSIGLGIAFGLWGVMAGTLISIVLLSVLLIVRFMREYQLSRADARRTFAPPTLLALAVAVPVVPVVVATEALGDTRWSAVALLVGVTLLYGVPYWLLAGRFGLLPARITWSGVRDFFAGRRLRTS